MINRQQRDTEDREAEGTARERARERARDKDQGGNLSRAIIRGDKRASRIARTIPADEEIKKWSVGRGRFCKRVALHDSKGIPRRAGQTHGTRVYRSRLRYRGCSFLDEFVGRFEMESATRTRAQTFKGRLPPHITL